MFPVKQLLAALALAAISSSALAADAPPTASSDYSDGFCAGWRHATKVEQIRYAKWREIVVGNATPNSAFGIALGAIADSLPIMVLIPGLAGKFQPDDGREVDCTPKAPAASPPPETPKG